MSNKFPTREEILATLHPKDPRRPAVQNGWFPPFLWLAVNDLPEPNLTNAELLSELLEAVRVLGLNAQLANGDNVTHGPPKTLLQRLKAIHRTNEMLLDLRIKENQQRDERLRQNATLTKTATISPEMIREAEAHLPFDVQTSGNLARWEWLAAYLTRALAEPNKPCECCGATPQGDVVEDPEAAQQWNRGADEPYPRTALDPAGYALGPVSDGGLDPRDRPDPSVTVENAPLGTKAPATIGGHWCRVPGGWKWNGPGGNGGTFPRPGGDWNGQLILPEFRA